MGYTTAGIIFSGLRDRAPSNLTIDRTVAAIPFACRYRLIDICLSNFINSGISDISVVVNFKYRSLIEHIGSGKDWDLARRKAGINIVSPYQSAQTTDNKVFSTHLEALRSMRDFISSLKEEFVILMESNNVLNINLEEVLEKHKETGAAITIVTKRTKVGYESDKPQIMIKTAQTRISDIALCRKYNENNPERSLGLYVMRTEYLRKIIEEADAYSMDSLTLFILSTYKFSSYHTYCFDGYAASIENFNDYYNVSMELLNNEKARSSVFYQKDFPIFTRVHNSAPTIQKESAEVRNSLIADECYIEGRVINSILFRGVKIGKGAIVENSILFSGTHIDKDAKINCIVTDKNVYVSNGISISGNSKLPFFIEKGKRV